MTNSVPQTVVEIHRTKAATTDSDLCLVPEAGIVTEQLDFDASARAKRWKFIPVKKSGDLYYIQEQSNFTYAKVRDIATVDDQVTLIAAKESQWLVELQGASGLADDKKTSDYSIRHKDHPLFWTGVGSSQDVVLREKDDTNKSQIWKLPDSLYQLSPYFEGSEEELKSKD